MKGLCGGGAIHSVVRSLNWEIWYVAVDQRRGYADQGGRKRKPTRCLSNPSNLISTICRDQHNKYILSPYAVRIGLVNSPPQLLPQANKIHINNQNDECETTLSLHDIQSNTDEVACLVFANEYSLWVTGKNTQTKQTV